MKNDLHKNMMFYSELTTTRPASIRHSDFSRPSQKKIVSQRLEKVFLGNPFSCNVLITSLNEQSVLSSTFSHIWNSFDRTKDRLFELGITTGFCLMNFHFCL